MRLLYTHRDCGVVNTRIALSAEYAFVLLQREVVRLLVPGDEVENLRHARARK